MDVLQQTIGAVQLSGKFSVQLDETTDIGNDAQLTVFVRYRTSEDYEKQFLFCRLPTKNTTGEEIFTRVDFFFQEYQLFGLTVYPFMQMVLRQ